MTTVLDLLGFAVNPSPGDPTLTAGSDELGAKVVTANYGQPLDFTTSVAVTTGSGGYLIAVGSDALRLAGDGTLKFGPSLLYDAYPQRKMLDGGFDPVSLRLMGRGILLREVGNPAQIERGYRPGTFPYAVATTTLTAGVTISAAPVSVPVADTSQYQAGGGSAILEPAGGGFGVVFTYTARSTTSGAGNLTGATILVPAGGSQAFIAGDVVNAVVTDTTTLSTDYAAAWMGLGGWQIKGAQTSAKAAGDQYPDMTGGYYAAEKWYLSTPTPGPGSFLKDRVVVDERGFVGILGGGVEDYTLVSNVLTVGGPASRTVGVQAYNAATHAVDSTAGWPASAGTINDGNGHIFAYTGFGADGKSFTGCTPAGGSLTTNIPNAAKLKPDPAMGYVAVMTPHSMSMLNLNATGNISHTGTAVGFFSKAAINQPGGAGNAYADGSGLGLPATRTLPAAPTVNQVAQLLLQVIHDLGDTGGVGLVHATI